MEDAIKNALKTKAKSKVMKGFYKITKFILKYLLKLIAPILPLLLVIFIIAASIVVVLQGGQEDGSLGDANVSQAVLKWKPDVEKYAAQYQMSDYVNLILAIIQQESGGTVPDVMQSSEGPFNTLYPRVPNGITDSDYSIACGIQELQQDFKEAGVKNPSDLADIKMGLQAYNFGDGFISFAKSHGGYSLQTAQAFATKMGGHYGDTDYVDHVLRYLNNLSGSGATGKLASVISTAQQQLGKPYVYGASGPDSFDCSGLIYFCYKSAGYNIQRETAEGYYEQSQKVSNPQVGDLVFFGTPGSIEHIGIYVGNGQMLNAPHTGTVVKIEAIPSNNAGYGHING
ncbi:MAG: bifunctional lytic transglycosylase/C40 family peptidase [Clostridium sp.]|nr:bifunctional lytic transglycosylase/C40 family peptidase [Clostridium sp.]